MNRQVWTWIELLHRKARGFGMLNTSPRQCLGQAESCITHDCMVVEGQQRQMATCFAVFFIDWDVFLGLRGRRDVIETRFDVLNVLVVRNLCFHHRKNKHRSLH